MSWMFSLLCNYWLLVNFDILYFSTDACINKSLTYLLAYLHVRQVVRTLAGDQRPCQEGKRAVHGVATHPPQPSCEHHRLTGKHGPRVPWQHPGRWHRGSTLSSRVPDAAFSSSSPWSSCPSRTTSSYPAIPAALYRPTNTASISDCLGLFQSVTLARPLDTRPKSCRLCHLLKIHASVPLASPAIRDTGARAPSPSNCLFFVVTSEPHKLWHWSPCGFLYLERRYWATGL